MPRQITTQVESNFIGGLITEATALNFPQNACVDTDNCVFHPKGSVYRRPGLDYESGYTLKTFDYTGVITQFYWSNAGGASKNFLVIQSGSKLYFVDVSDSASLSSGWRATSIDLTAYDTDPGSHPVQDYRCQFSQGQGYLFVVHPYLEPIYVEYVSSTDILSASQITIYVRDTEGVVDETNYAYDTRPTTLTNKHAYNIYNQGWFPTATADFIYNWRNTTGYNQLIPIPVAPYFIVQFNQTSPARTDYPSNADVQWLMRDATENWNNNPAENSKRGNTPAPKGYFIMNAFNMDRITASTITTSDTRGGGGLYADWVNAPGVPLGSSVTVALTGVASTTSGVNRPQTTAFFAGRVFYAGTQASEYSNRIFFTQVIKSREQFGRCHQLNDPTNDRLFELLATDGGTITIPEAAQIIKLFSIQNSLLVFATNGVWSISGNEGIGFSAGDYTIRKVSSVPAISGDSFIDVEGLPCWWNFDGIYMVTEVNAAGGVKVDNLSQSTIRRYFNESILANNKLYASGAYSYLTKEIKWLFRTTAPTTIVERYEYDKVLTFNIFTKAFYPWTLSTSTVKTNGLACFKSYGDNSGVTGPSAGIFKYLSSYLDGTRKVTFSEIKDTTRYKDFYTKDTVGVDFTSYFVTGYKLQEGQASRKFQSNYVTLFLANRQDSQIYLQSQWNFANAETSGRWGTNQLILFPENETADEFDYIHRKIKVRGTGKALQFRFTSVSGKPFDVAGWSRFETVNQGI